MMSQTNQTETDENRQNHATDDLDALCQRLTADQIRFVIARQEYNSDKAAGEFLGISPHTIKDWKYKGAPIDEAVKLFALDGLVIARNIRRRSLAKAMLVKVAGLDSDDERLRQSVSTEIIEWEMGKAQQAIRHSGTGKDGAIPIEIREVLVRMPGDNATTDAMDDE